MDTSSPDMCISCDKDVRAVNPALKRCAEIVGDPHFTKAGSHGMRPGFACDLALFGGTLEQILKAGDWRSKQFQEYIASVRDELVGHALMKMVGDVSDSDDE